MHAVAKSTSFLYRTRSQNLFHLLSCTHEDAVHLCAKHFATQAVQILVAVRIWPFQVFRIIGTGGRYTSSFIEPHRKKSKGSDLQITEIRTWTTLGQPTAQATAYSRMLSSHCGCVIALASPSANICSHEQFEGPNTNSDCTNLDSLYRIMFGRQSNRGLMCAGQQNSTRCT
jgi:hypothetical protein